MKQLALASIQVTDNSQQLAEDLGHQHPDDRTNDEDDRELAGNIGYLIPQNYLSDNEKYDPDDNLTYEDIKKLQEQQKVC